MSTASQASTGEETTKRLAPLMSSARTGTGRDDWETPESVLTAVRAIGPIHLDPCTSESNPVEAATFYTKERPLDHSIFDWPKPWGLAYVNPPYSELRAWMNWCRNLSEWSGPARIGRYVIALVPARTDTRAWHEAKPSAVHFIKGRLTFKGAPGPAPFPSALLFWGFDSRRFVEAMRDHLPGQCLIP